MRISWSVAWEVRTAMPQISAGDTGGEAGLIEEGKSNFSCG